MIAPMPGVVAVFSTSTPNSSPSNRAIMAFSPAINTFSRCATCCSSRSATRPPKLLHTMPNASRSRWKTVMPYSGSPLPQRGLQLGGEELPVRQPGQHVVQRLPLELSLQQLQFGAVLDHHDEVAGLLVRTAQQ